MLLMRELISLSVVLWASHLTKSWSIEPFAIWNRVLPAN